MKRLSAERGLSTVKGITGVELKALHAEHGLLELQSAAMAASYGRDNIRVNSIIPETMDTPMNASALSDSAAREQFLAAIPLGRLGKPDDVSGLAVFLASNESSYCSGGLYTCDGGLTAI